MYRGFTKLPKRQRTMVAERFVDRRRSFVKNFGGFKSENADMSNEKSCKAMIAVSSRVSAFCFSAQSDPVSKCVFDKKPRWKKWKMTKCFLETNSLLDSFFVSNVSRKNLHKTDRTLNRHRWTSRVDSGVERTILKELGKFFLYLWKKGSQFWWHKNGGDDFLLKN